MLHVFEVVAITGLNFMIATCLIPDLSVQMLDRRLIERKRQDTLDMCRLFTAETEKLTTSPTHKTYKNKGKKRPKRETGVDPTNVEVENALRVESIVDKLYEDLEENGEKVTYRQSDLKDLTTKADKPFINGTGRRFDFAPAELLGPSSTTVMALSGVHDVSNAGNFDWPKRWKHGIVPYYIDSKTYDTQLADVIMKAFDYFEKSTCIRLQRLKDRPTDKESLQKVEWLYVTNPAGLRQCVHTNEKKTNIGVQMVVFGYDCMSIGEIVHEVMHILGFSHEHTRPDRDQHITILWNNIKPGYKKYFELRKSDPLLYIRYDHASILHYPPRAFSKNGQLTIMAQPGAKYGQRDGLSEGDVEKVGIIYGNECVERNRQYLIKTCPSVVRSEPRVRNVTQAEIMEYFEDRLWPYGVINFKLRDNMEFSAEEKENIKAVIRHIEKETCIQFRDISTDQHETPDTKIDEANNGNDDENPAKSVENPDKDIHALNDYVGTTNGDIQTLINSNENIDETRTTSIPSGDDKNAAEDSQRPDVDNEISRKDENVANAENDQPNLRTGSSNKTSSSKPKLTSTTKAPNAGRRHASDIMILARSVEPGCACPTPGKPNGEKVLHINADCFNSVNDLLHLFVHVLGLDHQHNTHDRDAYLHILWDNLTPDIKMEMETKLPPAASLGFDYDYQSVMHYPWLQIKNGVTNIMYPIWNDGWAMGHWQGLSSTDVFKLNLIYFEQCLERKKAS